MAAKATAKDDAQPGSILLVIHNFVARSADELSLAKGDRIELIEKDDDFGDGWFLGRHMTNNNTGLFPEVYTTPAPRGTFTNSVNRRASDGPPKTTNAGSAVAAATSAQQRHLSASAVTAARPSTATSSQTTSPPQPPTLRTSAASTSSLSKMNAMHTDSPVMNETLSVIDEHMNDMQAPRPPFANGNQRDTVASSVGSVYSSQPLNRFSYIAGHETDEEEQQLHSETEVLAWGPERVAEYLEDNGVEKMHCDVFREQEITGEVLLAMDQSSLFIKEFDLGPVGRRLKTWHKIKALQDEVKQAAAPEVSSRMSVNSAQADETRDTGRVRSSTMSSALPRALLTISRPPDAPARSSTMQPTPPQPSTTSPVASRSSVMAPLQPSAATQRNESSQRPSAQTIRAMQHSRRHSSIDSTANSIESSSRLSHRKQPSLDRKWQPGQAMRSAGRPGHSHALSTDSVLHKRESTGGFLSASPSDLDGGYSSSVDLRDTSKTGKTRSASATRVPASNEFADRRTSQVLASKALRDSPKTGTRPNSGDGVWGAMNAVGNKLGKRAATSPPVQSPTVPTTSDGTSPVVTKLDYDDAATTSSTAEDSTKTSSPGTHKFNFFSTQRAKITGLRTISDAVTKDEKSASSPDKDFKMDSPARAGVATPSTDTTSIDLQKSEVQSRTSQGSGGNFNSGPNVIRRPRARTKTKKLTSAYTRGLESKPPAEQMQNCDYSGWMKKKSGSLMATWKTRLFILRGRRLSYYYAENDTEEKGLIDISFHRVLPAQNETLTGIHASITGAMSTPVSPKEGQGFTETTAQQDLKQPPKPGDIDDDGAFIFKLVPPKTGLSKGVNFTRPTVHYFAVNSRREGRLWMAALMKATIDRDEESVVTTTYNQTTISLKQARARKERPPALKDTDGDDEEEDDEGGGGDQDLNGALQNLSVGDQLQQGLGIGLPANSTDDPSGGAGVIPSQTFQPAILAASTAAARSSTGNATATTITTDVTTERESEKAEGASFTPGSTFTFTPASSARDAEADAADAEADRMVWLEKQKELGA